MNGYCSKTQGLLFFPAKALCLMEFSAIFHCCGMSFQCSSQGISINTSESQKKKFEGTSRKIFYYNPQLRESNAKARSGGWGPCPLEFRNVQDEVPQPLWAAVPVQHWGRQKNFSLCQNRISFAACVHCFITFCCLPLRRFWPHPLHSPSVGSESSLLSS